jgi:hypothetical protein
MKNAAFFVVGFVSICLWLPDGARRQTSLAQPLSLAPPPPLTERGSPPPATNNSVWPPMTTNDVPPPTAVKRPAPPMAAKDPPRPATSQRSPRPATAEDTPPTRTDNVLSTPIATPPPSPKPAADYDGFTVGTVDNGDTSGQTARPVRRRPAAQPKRRRESGGIEEQQSVNQVEDEKLSRKLTICRGCKE